MNYFTEKSLVIQYWYFVLPILVIIVTLLYLKKLLISKNEQSKKLEKLDGEEYIGVDEFGPETSTEEEEFTPSLEEKDHIPFNGPTITLEGGAKKFYEIVNNRRSVRSYSKKSVPNEIIETCIKSAGTAPSGAHTEPWTYCVISDPIIKSQIREIIENEEYMNYSSRMAKQWTTDLQPLRTNHVKEYLTDASHLILVFKQTYGIRKDGKRKQHYYNEISVAISTGILLCALQASGLSSLVTTPLNCGPALRNLLNRPSNEKLLVLLPVGYPSDDCKIPNLF